MIPADIDKKEFKTTRVKEGYDQDEVDNFLDAVAVEWEAAETALTQKDAEITRLKRELAEAQRIADAYDVTQPIPVPPASESAARILEFAQRTADDVMADAKAQADNTKALAENEANELLSRSKAQADAIMNEARGTVYQLEQEKKKLDTAIRDTKEHVRGYLRRALNELEETGG